jgi:hypothetical protein
MARVLAALVCTTAAITACTDLGWQTRTFDGGAYEFKRGRFDLKQMEATALAVPGAHSNLRSDRLEVLVPGKAQIYLFTRASNTAHPSVIILSLKPQVTPFHAYTAASTASFDDWLAMIGRERDQIVATYLDSP